MSATTTELQKLAATHSKADEIDALATICRHYAGSQTCLESLFSSRMLGWFARNANDDFSTDLYAALVAAEAEARAQMQAARDAGQALETAYKGLEAARQTFRDESANARLAHDAEMDSIRADNKAFKDARAAQNDRDAATIARLTAERDEMADAYGETSADLRDARADRTALEAEVIRLKARILDLIDAAAEAGH